MIYGAWAPELPNTDRRGAAKPDASRGGPRCRSEGPISCSGEGRWKNEDEGIGLGAQRISRLQSGTKSVETFHLFELLRDLRDHLADGARFVVGLRRRWRRPDLLAREQAVLDINDDTLAATGSGVDEPIDAHRLAAAIAELSPLARDIFILHCRENCDYASIAARLAIPEDAVRRELAAALVALDQALSVEPGDDISTIA